MTHALTVDGVLAKARAFRTFSLIDSIEERIKEQIVQDGIFEPEVLALRRRHGCCRKNAVGQSFCRSRTLEQQDRRPKSVPHAGH
jgi:hypothetical protein